MSDHARPWMARDADASPRSYGESYQLSGKIMLSAIVILFFVVVLMVCLHVYARWYLLRSRRRRTRRSRRGNLVFHVDPAAARGLDASVLRALPVFVVGKEPAGEEEPGECAVCLSEFATGEAGRRLPKCGHSFHTECIDMWFHSHATCPLCRSPVEAGSGQEARVDAAEPDALCPECEGSSSSVSAAMTIEVPRRNFESVASPTTPFRSPMSRMLSFTRILSRDRRNGGVSPAGNCSNGNGNGSASGSAANELDIERGKVGTPTQ